MHVEQPKVNLDFLKNAIRDMDRNLKHKLVRRSQSVTKFSFFWWYRNRYRKNLVPKKGTGIGIESI